MSSTESDAARLLSDFYKSQLRRVGESLRAGGASLLPFARDDDSATYYTERDDESDYLFDYDSGDFAKELARRWSGEGNEELLQLAELLGQLAERLEMVESTSDDVSPFIYAMF